MYIKIIRKLPHVREHASVLFHETGHDLTPKNVYQNIKKLQASRSFVRFSISDFSNALLGNKVFPVSASFLSLYLKYKLRS